MDNKQFAIKMLPSILVSNKRAYAQLKGEVLVAMRLEHAKFVLGSIFEENSVRPFRVMDSLTGSMTIWGAVLLGRY